MSSTPGPEEIARDASWLAQALDPAAGMVRLIKMDREAYRSASFLDDRMMQRPVDGRVVPWATVQNAIREGVRRDARWIFHIGHVGSTLIARLLGELPGVLSVREPRLLRDIMPVAERRTFTDAAQRLFSRTFGPDEVALVKATSFVSDIAPELVPPGERALLMYATPANYIASILAGENSVHELRVLAPSRTQRLERRVTSMPPAHNDAELAAIAWACEMTAVQAAADAMADRRIEWTDFDLMLDDMAGELARIADFFGFAADDAQIRAIAQGPLMNRYSKALEYEYTAQLRRDLIRQATAEHRDAIDGALAMLRSAAEKSPLLARALSRPEG